MMLHRRIRCMGMGLLALAVLAPQALARDDGLMARYRCPVSDYLARLALDTKNKDRFLELSPRERHENYVQCLFLPDRMTVVCEAASGFYFHGRNFLTTSQRDALARLGFEDAAASGGNYQRRIALENPVQATALAELLLTVLRDVYGANDKTELDMDAPRLGDVTETPPPLCVPSS